MAKFYLDFEKEIVELEEKIKEKKIKLSPDDEKEKEEISILEEKLQKMIKETYSNLTIWQRVQLARHYNRPYTLDYISRITENFMELHGDRFYSDDTAIIAGLAVINGKSMIIIGHQKGRDTKGNIYRNFGMANPEGYRKALRIMKIAEKFKKPIVTLIDTPGAFPGKGAEERCVAEAIAKNMYEMTILKVPILCIVTGEGGSGGAIAIGLGDRVLMLENSIYSVISPEGCASIIFRDSGKAKIAAESLKITAYELLELGFIDGVIPEPLGGAHREVDKMAEVLKERILKEIEELEKIDTDILIKNRIEKYSKMGYWEE
jgi:acetyl-CoA carboxylase carboxyl transferase subunit alpha